MRVVKMIPITNLTPPIFLGWAKRLYNYMKQLLGTVIHITFDVYEEEGQEFRKRVYQREEKQNQGREKFPTYINSSQGLVNEQIL